MGLFCGKKCECKRRCRSWFGMQPDLERACENACKGNTGLQREDFLCSGQYVDEQLVMGAYGYDPCPASEVVIDDYLDPTKQREQNQERMKSLQPLFLGLLLLIGAGLAVLYFTKT